MSEMEIVAYLEEFLPLSAPFSVSHVKKDEALQEVHIYLSVSSADLSSEYTVHSYYGRVWEHLPLFQYRCFLHCDIPIYQHRETKKLHKPALSFSRDKSRFTLLYEAEVLRLLKETFCFSQVARHLKIRTQRVEHLYHYYTQDLSIDTLTTCPVRIAFDETSTRKGHDYITTFYDLDTKQVIGIYDGRASDCVKQFCQDHPYPEAIQIVSMDMSPAFISGINTYFPQADITFDKWHVIKLLYKHLDHLRQKAKDFQDKIGVVMEQITDFYKQTDPTEAHAQLTFIADFAEDTMGKNPITSTIKRHAEGIINYFTSKVTNGIMEGLNAKIQLIKRIARGFRYTDNFKKMIRFAFRC
jgi:transposase